MGFGAAVHNAIEVCLNMRSAQEVASHPLISKYFRYSGADEMVPEQYRGSGFRDYLASGV